MARGSVAAGKQANPVLLDTAVAGVQNLHGTAGVVRARNHYSATALEGLKKKTEDRVLDAHGLTHRPR